LDAFADAAFAPPSHAFHEATAALSVPAKPKLNQVERFVAEITEKRIRRGSFRSVKSLQQAIMEYLDNHNKDPKPFAWTATAEKILERVARVCKRVSDSGQ
jgi:hypothetical protein